MTNIALLALEASDATVVLTSITLVFGMLVALCLIITLEGKIFDSLAAKKKPPKAPQAPKASQPARQAPQAAAPAVPNSQSAAPAAGGIPGEIIAAIAAAVASLEGEGAVIRGIRRLAAPARSRRGSWGDTAAREQTTPFM